MPLRRIAVLGEPILRRVAEPVSLDELGSPALEQLIGDLIETMRDAPGVGIAAPQVYESRRVVVLEVAENPRYPWLGSIPLTVLINPVVTPVLAAGGLPERPAPGDGIVMYEGCLSVPGLRGRVRRPRRVRVTALDRHGAAVEREYEGLQAAVVQHELDHLDGVLFIDRADPRSLCYAREYERHVPAQERALDEAHPPARAR